MLIERKKFEQCYRHKCVQNHSGHVMSPKRCLVACKHLLENAICATSSFWENASHRVVVFALWCIIAFGILAGGIHQFMWMQQVVVSLHHSYTQTWSGTSDYPLWRVSMLVVISMGLSMLELGGAFGGTKRICLKSSSSISTILVLISPLSPSISPKVNTSFFFSLIVVYIIS